MNGENGREREERALDALLVSILRRIDKDDEIVEPSKLPELTEEEKAAMNSLPPDFVDRIIAGERPIKRAEESAVRARDDNDANLVEAEADVCLNRAEEIDEETAEELKRKEQEIIKRKGCQEK